MRALLIHTDTHCVPAQLSYSAELASLLKLTLVAKLKPGCFAQNNPPQIPLKENALQQSRSSPASCSFLCSLQLVRHKLNYLPEKTKLVHLCQHPLSLPFTTHTSLTFVYYKILLTLADYQSVRRDIS